MAAQASAVDAQRSEPVPQVGPAEESSEGSDSDRDVSNAAEGVAGDVRVKGKKRMLKEQRKREERERRDAEDAMKKEREKERAEADEARAAEMARREELERAAEEEIRRARCLRQWLSVQLRS